MNKEEFLQGLSEKLSEDLSPGDVEEQVAYYRGYIDGELKKGRTEEEATFELGDPILIARNLVESPQSYRVNTTNAYEQGHDMLTMNNATSNTAALLWTENYGGKRLAIEEAPLVNNQAMYDLRIYAPADGTYSLSAAAKEGADLYVTYEGAIVWNLSLGDYEMDLVRGTTTGYGLLLVVQPNQMPTGVENGELLNGENGVQKILLNGQLYILRDGHLYDAVGKEMK